MHPQRGCCCILYLVDQRSFSSKVVIRYRVRSLTFIGTIFIFWKLINRQGNHHLGHHISNHAFLWDNHLQKRERVSRVKVCARGILLTYSTSFAHRLFILTLLICLIVAVLFPFVGASNFAPSVLIGISAALILWLWMLRSDQAERLGILQTLIGFCSPC
jgi:hypothetical protein